MKKLILASASVFALILSGCTTAGPYVTSITSNGDGTITVEKATVHYNGFTGAVSQGENVTTQTIRICPKP